MNSSIDPARIVTECTTRIVVAWLESHRTEAVEIKSLIEDVTGPLVKGFAEAQRAARGNPVATAEAAPSPALEMQVPEVTSVVADVPGDGAITQDGPVNSVADGGEDSPEAEASEAEVSEAVPETEDTTVEAEPPAETYPFEHIPRETWNGLDPEDAIQPNRIICLIDGVGRKMLHRYLFTKYQMTPADYIEHFGLRSDYPMTAAKYSEEKSKLARAQQFGKRKKAAAEATPATPVKVRRRSRTKAVEAA